MVGWHRHVQSIIRQVGKRVENSCHTHANFSSSPLKLSPVQGLPPHLHGLWAPSTNVSRPLYHHFQQLGFSSSKRLLSSEAAGPSPLTPTLATGSGQTEAEKAVAKPSTVQAILKCIKQQMSKGLIWATEEDMAKNRGKILSLYRQVLRSLNSPDLPLNLAARLHRKAQARAIFMLGAEERSVHNIKDLLDVADYSLSLLRKGEIPKYIQ